MEDPEAPEVARDPERAFDHDAVQRQGRLSLGIAGDGRWLHLDPESRAGRCGLQDRPATVGGLDGEPALVAERDRTGKCVRPVVEDRYDGVGTRRDARRGRRRPVDERVGERRELVRHDSSGRERATFADPEPALERLEVRADQPRPAFVWPSAEVGAEAVVEPDIERGRRVAPSVTDREAPVSTSTAIRRPTGCVAGHGSSRRQTICGW